jgi:branched-chain amino acid transport system substrate-binding protein
VILVTRRIPGDAQYNGGPVKRRFVNTVAAVAAVSLFAAGCADNGSGGGDSVGEGDTIKVGLMYDVTGPAAAGSVGTDTGAKARIDTINAAGGINGRKLELVIGDSASTPAGAQSAAKTLVEQHGVFAVMTWTYTANAAAPYLEQQKVPVIGGSWDSAPQWAHGENFFGTQPANTEASVVTTYGNWFKQAGVTKAASIGLNTASGKTAAEKVAESIRSAGIDVPLVNTSIDQTTADFGPTAIAVKNSGVDGLYVALAPNGIYALAAALKQQNVNVKLAMAGTGYGQDLLDNPSARQGADGMQFVMHYQPKELNTDATKAMVTALEGQGFTGSPGFAVAGGYTDVDLFAHGLRLAGDDVTRENFISKLRDDTSWNGEGLMAGTASFPEFVPAGPGLNYGNCMYVSELRGESFVPVVDTPYCGDNIG